MSKEKLELPTADDAPKLAEFERRVIAGVRHGLNNLMTAILTCTKLVDDRCSREEMLEYVGEIEIAARRSAELTRLLAPTRFDSSSSPRAVELAARLREWHPIVQRVVGMQVGFRLELEAEPATVQTIPDQLAKFLLLLAFAGQRSTSANELRLRLERRVESAAEGPGHIVLIMSFSSAADDRVGRGETVELSADHEFLAKARHLASGLGAELVSRQDGEATLFEVRLRESAVEER